MQWLDLAMLDNSRANYITAKKLHAQVGVEVGERATNF